MAEEEVKPDEIKPDEVKPDEIKPDDVKPDEQARKSALADDEVKPDEVKPDEVKPDEEVDYSTVELPEGVTLDEAALEHFAPRLKELGVSSEKAKDLFSDFAKYQETQMQRQLDEFNKAWDADAAVIGKMPKEDLGAAKAAMNAFFDDEGAKLLSGRIGDSPALVRALVKIGKAMREDKFVEGEGAGSQKAAEDILYPTMNE